MNESTIIYTRTDEAPLLATYSLLPIISAYAAKAGVEVETRDISLAGLILAQSGPETHRSPMDRQRTRDMLPVANKPILFHALDSMAAAGIKDVAIAVTTDAELVISEAVGSGASWGLRGR